MELGIKSYLQPGEPKVGEKGLASLNHRVHVAALLRQQGNNRSHEDAHLAVSSELPLLLSEKYIYFYETSDSTRRKPFACTNTKHISVILSSWVAAWSSLQQVLSRTCVQDIDHFLRGKEVIGTLMILVGDQLENLPSSLCVLITGVIRCIVFTLGVSAV